MSSRKATVAGTFYPRFCSEIEESIADFDKLQKSAVEVKFEPKAIISPHAGYVYSGFTANCAFKLIDKKRFKRVVVIGPSHRAYIKGASIALYDEYDTPCGSLKIDLKYSKSLMKSYKFLSFSDDLHREHSTETQMPFVKHYLPDVEVVEIVYGDIDYSLLAPLVKEILDEPDTLLVISTDLSHFHKLEDAKKIDNICLTGVKELDNSLLTRGCEACGIIGVQALVEVAKESQLVDYRTSFDASGDTQRVVGYLSALLK